MYSRLYSPDDACSDSWRGGCLPLLFSWYLGFQAGSVLKLASILATCTNAFTLMLRPQFTPSNIETSFGPFRNYPPRPLPVEKQSILMPFDQATTKQTLIV